MKTINILTGIISAIGFIFIIFGGILIMVAAKEITDNAMILIFGTFFTTLAYFVSRNSRDEF